MLTFLINYSKAFNRLDFGHWLKWLARKGACKELLEIIASFLKNRDMWGKIGQVLSDPNLVLGGIPQWSLLRVFLFNIAIDEFEAFSNDVQSYGQVLSDDAELVPPTLTTPVPPEPQGRDYRHLPLG